MSNKIQLSKEKQIDIATKFAKRMADEGIKEGSKTYKKLDFYHWLGVLTGLQTVGYELNPIVTICLMTDRIVTEEILTIET